MRNPMLDKDFLYELNQHQHKEIYARIISLNYAEHPLEAIEGRVTTGSLNIDGNSAIRRTCNLTLVAKDVNITDFYWGVSNKFTLEIGVRNFINPIYPDIIWFKQGIFVISSFNSSLTNNNYTISIGGKDKMCLLNGDLGGNLPASIDFGKIDTYKDSFIKAELEDKSQYRANKYYVYDLDSDKFITSKDEFDSSKTYFTKSVSLEQESLKLKDIIREAVHTYGKESYSNIIINDLDETGLELLEYRGDVPLYLLYSENDSIYTQMIDGERANNFPIVRIDTGKTVFLSDLLPTELNNAVDDFNNDRIKFYLEDGEIYSATKVEYGEVCGYRETDLVYAGELISSIGETLTSILDKIKGMLGAFEYFYDIDGRFIFQEKKIHSNHSWNTLQNFDKNVFARDAKEDSQYSYSFEDVNLIQRFQNTPTINNLKNDYSIWGVRKGASGAEIPIHARYAIHEKPVYYQSFEGNIYTTLQADDLGYQPNEKMLPEYLRYGFDKKWWHFADWAEVYKKGFGEYPKGGIGQYGMSICYFDLTYHAPAGSVQKDPDLPLFLFETNKYGQVTDISHNPAAEGISNAEACGHTYEDFMENINEGGGAYIYDPVLPPYEKKIFGNVDWREIIYQMAVDYFKHNQEPDFYYHVAQNNIKQDGSFQSYYPTGETGYEMFYTDVQGFWRQLYDPNPDITYNSTGGYYSEEKEYEKDAEGKELETYKVITVWNPFVEDEIFSCDYFLPPDKTIYSKVIVDEKTFNKQKSILFYATGATKDYRKVAEDDVYDSSKVYYIKSESDVENYSKEKAYWNKNVVNAPDLLNFWFDFYEGAEDLKRYSIANLGDRPKVVNNNKVTSIYFRNIPQVIFETEHDGILDYDRKTGYTYARLNDSFENLFNISALGKSAEEEMNELINVHSYCVEGLNISAIPIYNLEPNSLIHIHNEENGINGKYQVTRISIPLTYNGMMQISATKIIDAIY